MAEETSTSPREDWPTTVTARIVDTVEQVRAKTTQPAITVSRGVVFGLVLAILGIAAVVLIGVAIFRAVDNYLPEQVWASYLVVGGLFTIIGLVLWSKRVPRTA